MSKTGGGCGTNQYGVRGQSVGDQPGQPGQRSAAEPDIELPPARQHVELYAGDFAFPSDSDFNATDIRPKGVERAVARFIRRKTNLIFNDARLEGINFTEPEIATLVDGGGVDPAASDLGSNRVIALSEATDLVLTRVRAGEFDLSKRTSDDVHRLLAPFDALEAGMFRGEGQVGGGGTVNVRGAATFHAHSSDDGGAKLNQVYRDGVTRIRAIEHPAVRSATYSAFAAYHQFYLDANKRTGRLLMNGELISNGYDAVVTPVAREAEYHDALQEMYETGDPHALVRFTLSCWDDN